MNQNQETTSIISPLRKGDIINSKGQPHEVIKFLHCSKSGLIYNTRNPLTGNCVQLTVSVVCPPPQEEVEESGYFQIMALSVKNVATLKPWGRDETRRIKVWDEGDVKVIKDGLMMEDKEVFCTIQRVMGKEVMGDFKFMPKDPLIMRVPDLVMDMIFSNLSMEDRLNCRLVTPTWTYDLLSVHRLLNCSTLVLGSRRETITAYFRPYPTTINHEYQVPIKELQPLIDHSLLKNVEKLSLCKGREGFELQGFLDQIHKANYFELKCDRDYPTTDDEEIWTFIKEFVSNNKEHLKTIKIRSYPGEVLDVGSLIGGCGSLETLQISLGYQNNLVNLQTLPTSIKYLSLVRMSQVLNREDISWITTNLTELTRMEVDFNYSLPEDNIMIADILRSHPSLKCLTFLSCNFFDLIGCLDVFCYPHPRWETLHEDGGLQAYLDGKWGKWNVGIMRGPRVGEISLRILRKGLNKKNYKVMDQHQEKWGKMDVIR